VLFVQFGLLLVNEKAVVPIIKQLQDALQTFERANPDLEKILKLFQRTSLQNRMVTFGTTFVNILFCAVPVLLRKASYELPIAWIFVVYAAFDVVNQTGRADYKKTSSERKLFGSPAAMFLKSSSNLLVSGTPDSPKAYNPSSAIVSSTT
jgi:hypothetical protein